MQVGIDVGATKIESVVLEENGNETHRSRTECPKDYFTIIKTIKDIYFKLENEFKSKNSSGAIAPIDSSSLYVCKLSWKSPFI